jgi:uncharacterized membrane protein YheB (UPF0754 family)
MPQLAAEVQVLLIPVVSAFIGWVTNVLAVKMMFYPTKFVGIPPFLGWQGIVPANAERLARVSNKLVMTKLLTLEELFADFKPEVFGKNLGHVIDEIAEQIITEVAEKRAPMMWQNAGEFMQQKARDAVRAEVQNVLLRISSDFSDNITSILDLEQVVVDAVLEDRSLMSRMFLDVGTEEFKFIERSGLWFGFLFGLVQMAVWILYPIWWVLPFFGFLVGYVTNWIALKLVFEPQTPKRIGPFMFQGLFHKRQSEVATAFSSIVAGKVLNADNIVRTVTSGPTGDKVLDIVDTRIDELVSQYEQHPMASMVMPDASERDAVRQDIKQRTRDDIAKPGGILHVFAAKAVDIRDNLERRMKALPSNEFEGVLRPAFQQDEWKLILAGAVLGFAAGLFQLVYIFGREIPSFSSFF